MEPTNLDRADWAASALRHFQRLTGTDYEDSLGDLLCDLMHFADFDKFDFERELGRARDHYQAEKAEAVPSLLLAAEKVVSSWESGDLAAAVRELGAAVDHAKGGAA